MTALSTTVVVCLTALLLAAAWFDARERRIPNALTVGGILLALTLAAADGLAGLVPALAGAGIAMAVALPVFLLGGLGGGDVKLLTAVGAFLGPARLPIALVAIALVGGVLAAHEIVRQRAVRRALTNLRLIATGFGRDAFMRWNEESSDQRLTVHAPEAVTVPYAVAIALGVLLAQLVQ
jgi:prepilin peptidase CpaA